MATLYNGIGATYKYKGEIDRFIRWTPTVAVTGGDVVLISAAQLGYALNDIAVGATGNIAAPSDDCLFLVRKSGIGSVTFAIGDPVYFNIGTQLATATSSDVFMGVAEAQYGNMLAADTSAAGATDTQVTVRPLPLTSATTVNIANPATTAITDPGASGAIPITASGYVNMVSAGAETRTLAAPASEGELLLICFQTKVGNIVITCASTFNRTGNNTATFSAAGQSMLLIGIKSGSNLLWMSVVSDAALTTI
jgi:predicted RecA/RadA family phage recombinase